MAGDVAKLFLLCDNSTAVRLLIKGYWGHCNKTR